LVHPITTETSCDQLQTTQPTHTIPLKITFCHIVPNRNVAPPSGSVAVAFVWIWGHCWGWRGF